MKRPSQRSDLSNLLSDVVVYMPKGRGLGIAGEVASGDEFAQRKRWQKIYRLHTDYDWPHLKDWMMSRSWKRHRKTQYKVR